MAQQEKAKKEAKQASGRGGARPGAGRKSGSGAFGEPTVPMRVPASWAPHLEQSLERLKSSVSEGKQAGKSAAAVDWSAPGPAAISASATEPSGRPVDLGKLLSPRPQSCFVWVAPRDDEALGLREGDAVVIERDAPSSAGALVASWGEAGLSLSIAPKGKKGEPRPWGVAVGVVRRLG